MKSSLKYLNQLAAGALIVLLFSGCDKFLDRKPLGNATEGDLTVGGVEGKAFGLYGSLRTTDGLTNFPMLWFKTIRSDDAIKGSTTGDLADAGQMMDNFQYAKDHWLLNNYWTAHYTFINACNDVIHEVDSLNLTDAGSLINKGEATFFRAYAYFDLVRDYGDVPIVTKKVYTPTDGNKPKSPVTQVYAQIEADLTFAAQNLPATWGAQYPGRVTKGTANALLAKAYLYRQNWAAALGSAETVINSGQYSLLGNFTDFFKESGENSSESILEVQMYVNQNGSQVISNNLNEVQGVRGSGTWDLGWGFNVPSAELEANGFEAGDPRKAATILYSGQQDGIYGQTVPAAPPLAQPFWNKKVYTDPVRRLQTGIRNAPWLNIRLLRYADVLLIAAEAANELGGAGNTTKALNYLNLVRTRARGGASGILPPVTTTVQADIRTAIKKERRAEFAMEYERFYDLVRWGDAATVLASAGYTNRHRYYPIPQVAIDRSGGVLVQNPEWP
jgi:hypothetical protein